LSCVCVCVCVCVLSFSLPLFFQIQELKQSWERQRKEINDCRSEITSLKMHIEGSRSGMNVLASDVDAVQSQSLEKYKEEIKSLQMEIAGLKAKGAYASESIDNSTSEKETCQAEEKVVEIDEDKTIVSHPVDVAGVLGNGDVLPLSINETNKPEEVLEDLLNSCSDENALVDNSVLVTKQNGEAPSEDGTLQLESDNLGDKAASENMASSSSSYQTLYSLPCVDFLFHFKLGGTSCIRCRPSGL